MDTSTVAEKDKSEKPLFQFQSILLFAFCDVMGIHTLVTVKSRNYFDH